MSFPKYAEYRSSGIHWLGSVPKHWKTVPLKAVALGQDTAFIDGDWIESRHLADTGIRYITTGNVGPGFYKEQGTGYISNETFAQLGCTPVQPGDVLISRLNAPIGRACVTPDLGIKVVTSVDNVIVRPSAQFNRRFLVFRLSSPDYFHETGNIASGATMQRISRSELGNIRIAFPPLDEQAAIATFLERETTKIDALIAEQEKLIALLAEKRQATISHAVTRGIAPNAPMKDSGVAWLGDIPAHWRVMPIKRDLTFLTSGSRGWAEHYADDGALFIRIGNLTRDRIELDLSDIQRVTVPDGAEGERTRVAPGDLLFSITAYLGSVAVVPESIEPAFVSQHVALARLRSECLLPAWVGYVCLSWVGKTYLASQGYGGTKVQLSLDDVGNMISTAPPLEEQRIILRFLNQEISKLAALSAQAQRGITLLKERRSALIAAAVTGQIDVRGTMPRPADSLEAIAA